MAPMAADTKRSWLFGAGLVTWAVGGAGALGASLPMGAPAVPAVAVWLAFGVAFVVMVAPRWAPAWLRSHALPPFVMLGAQSVLALALARLGHEALAGMLLVVVAGTLGLVARARVAAAWLALQSALLAFTLARVSTPGAAALETASWLGFQLFAAGVGLLAQREAAARAALARVHAELLATQALLADSVRNAERLRISRELHDSLGHHLTALSLQLELARNTAPGNAAVLCAQDITREMLASVREVVSTLRADADFDLSRALQLLIGGVAGLEVSLSLSPALERVDSTCAHALFRCVQEAITNTLRHARARRLWIELGREGDVLHLIVRDDGDGAHGDLRSGHGLTGLRERIAALGGQFAARSPAEGGFRLEVSLPYPGAS